MSAFESVKEARREARRCQFSIDAGGDREFWRKRLERAAKLWEAAAVILRMQMVELGPAPRTPPDGGDNEGGTR